MKIKECAKVISQECIAKNIYSMWIASEVIAQDAVPGQFISVFSKDGSRLLPRPISLCEIDKKQGRLRIVYRTVGAGTREFSGYKAGDPIDILGPLGNGFPEQEVAGKCLLLMGGGIGVPPMLQAAKSHEGEALIIAGYRDELFLDREFEQAGQLFVATEDGSCGTKGNVIDAFYANHVKADAIFACGPLPMLRAIKAMALKENIPCWISMEERMACGIGACLACVCKTTKEDGHSHVNNTRICKDGPVFLSTDVEL